MGGKAARAILIDDDPEFHETFRKALESVAVETGFLWSWHVRAGQEWMDMKRKASTFISWT